MLLFIFSNSSWSFPRILISIHLMLLFIISSPCLFSPFFKFQYISCYCLSVPFNKFLFCYIHFNTSHVTVYRIRNRIKFQIGVFQYISCYCLSSPSIPISTSLIHISIHLMLLFIQYIYSTSSSAGNISIHLMLLFI